jgi:outer membrane receptor protein involved in Fe transport
MLVRRFAVYALPVLCLSGQASGQADQPAPGAKARAIEEVVVTAERHRSTVQNTPISMTALSGAQLKARGITSVEEIVREVPGLSVRSAGPGQTEYEARGLSSTGGAAPTVGFYLNDVPMSPPAAAQTGKVVIDPDLYDISSVEVLRGPQGTLYGSGSMGGTVRVVTAQPKLGVYEGSLDGSASGTAGGGPNGDLNGMVNIPVGDKLAIRLVATENDRSGWIDRILLNPFPEDTHTRGNVLAAPVEADKKDVNYENLVNFRGSLLFKPNEDTTITAMALYQNTRMGGYDEYDLPPGASELAHYEAAPVAEPFHDIVKILSLTGTENFGWSTLTSDTAYWERNEKQTQDATENIGYTFGYYPYVSLPYSELDYTRQFSEEVRLASPESINRYRWVVGAFYSDLRSLWIENSANPSPTITGFTPGQNPGGLIFQSYNPYQIKQIAFFGDGSYNITPELKLSVGLRWNRYESTLEINEWGLAFPTQIDRPAHGTDVSTAANSVTPRFNLSWSPTPDFMAYVTASEGYRPGGLNQAVPGPPVCAGTTPASYQADSVWNYEIGEKARLMDGRLVINADFYYDDWRNIQQLLLLDCGYEYYDNAGNGRTFGPELEVTARITPEWTVSGSGAYTDAEITNPIPLLASNVATGALPGTISTCPSVSNCVVPILNVPNYTASLSLAYSRPVFDKYQLTARITDNYVGPVVDESYYPIINLAPYNLVNLRVGVSADKWTATVFINNLTNKHAEITANNTSFQFNIPAYVRIATNQPLTGGIELSYRF